MLRNLFFFIVFIQSIYSFGQSDRDQELQHLYTLFFSYKLDDAKNYIENNFLQSENKSRQIIGYVYMAKYYEYVDTTSNKKQIEEIENAKKIAEQTHNKLDQAYVDFGYAMYYKSINRWDYYIKSLWKSINSFKKYPNENFNLALLYISKYKASMQNPLEKRNVEDHTKALHYAKLSKNKILEGAIYIDIASFYAIVQGDTKTAKTYSEKSFQLSKEVENDDARKTLSFYYYNNIGAFYTSNQEYDKTLYYLNKGLEMVSVKKDSFYLASYHNNIGAAYAAMKKNEIALTYYKKAENYSKSKDISSNQKIRIATNIYETYEKLGQLDKALEYLKKVKDDISAEGQRRYDYNAQSLENFYKTEEQNNLLKERDSASQKQKKYLFVIIGLSVLSIIALIYTLYYRQRMTRQRTQFLESEKERLQIEKELSELKQEHYQKQILATSIQLEQKNMFLDELKDNIKKDKDFNLNSYFKNEQLIDKDLNNIQDIVKEVHPNFFKNLNDIAKNKLTNLDIKYAAYIYMNMNNSQIATVLNVDTKTVSVTKYRLKQKLGLTKDIDLDTFIRNLNSF